jgi:hypothetical protein
VQIKTHALHLLVYRLLPERTERGSMKTPWFKKVGIFFLAVYLLSGILWVPVLLSGEGLTTIRNKLIVGLITFTPSLLGILFVYITKDRAGRKDFWRRTLRWPRGYGKYVAAALSLPPVLALSTYLLSSWLNGMPIRFEYAGEMYLKSLAGEDTPLMSFRNAGMRCPPV